MAGEFQITYERQDDEMIAIIDYDAGNIKSVEKAMQLLGQGNRSEVSQRYRDSIPDMWQNYGRLSR